ncbi:3-deoxy-manno-octulosonate cytidylyltransferase [Polynucleobacter sp. HIN6]|uniref:3-deoxy-manno-octulosonate cytidylyltransferase n=1 Tax=Polynucleobacter sp. HIN6 TaxID=3047865 RepID=UPI0025743B7D|nr:3-deoxy-manno-octulosonate cytidylyltransferase [Polynucleobacter sp. HIN6]BEI34743.1 3-deoxy-manno-octulosonate cytidylyltransferase [Polynucleobacter sp. HIN6]
MTVFTVVIPARLASTRLERKALADLGGKPMVVRVAERAQQSKAKQILVATDAVEIEAACHAAGFNVLMTRADHPSGTDRIAEVASRLGLDDEALIVNVQGDEPLIPVELINQVADTLAANPQCVMSTAAVAIQNVEEITNPNAVKVVLNQQREALYFSRAAVPYDRTQSSPTYYRHIGIYAYRVGFLKKYAQLATSPLEVAESLEQLRALWHGYRIAVHLVSELPPAGVDTLEDLARVRAFF